MHVRELETAAPTEPVDFPRRARKIRSRSKPDVSEWNAKGLERSSQRRLAGMHQQECEVVSPAVQLTADPLEKRPGRETPHHIQDFIALSSRAGAVGQGTIRVRTVVANRVCWHGFFVAV